MKNIDEVKGELNAVYHTCTSEELASLTRKGWELVSSFEEQVEEELYAETVSRGDYNCVNSDRARRSELARKRKFLLKQSGETVAQQLRAELAGAHDDVRDAKHFQTKAEEELKAAEQERDRLKNAVDQLNEQNKRLTAARDVYAASNERMEEDLAKLRKHFGDKAFKEAVDPGK